MKNEVKERTIQALLSMTFADPHLEKQRPSEAELRRTPSNVLNFIRLQRATTQGEAKAIADKMFLENNLKKEEEWIRHRLEDWKTQIGELDFMLTRLKKAFSQKV